MPNRAALLDDPQLRAFLPLLYVAWADGDLSEIDRRTICDRLAAQPWLRPAARHAIDDWLDPKRPPDARELASVRTTLDRAVRNLSSESRSSLGKVAQALAADGERDESARAATEIAQLLAIDSLTSQEPTVAGDPSPHLPVIHIDVEKLIEARDGPYAEVRKEVRAFLDNPALRAYGLPRDEYRALVLEWLRELARRGFGKTAFPGITSDVPDLRPFMVAFESLAHGNLSLLVKFGVQFGLFGGSIYWLGTERHHALLADVASMKTLGCFAMSEVGHGSNVSDVETVAHYDEATRELVVHTPSESARKEWIGGAAHDARIATVFAQLVVGEERHGVHAILVPIRDEAGNPLPYVRIGDTGRKMGLHGVDNGRLMFDHARVPVANMLDRYAQIDEHGAYTSAIASPSKRFFTMLGTLVGGRICVGGAGVSVAETALAIAIRYSLMRRQFGPAQGREMPLLAYPTQQRRLLVPLATTYVLRFAFEQLREEFVAVHAQENPDTRELEAQAAALKSIATWHAIDTVQQCRESCGGQGYLAVNRLPDLRTDADVFATFEGDNTVLMQLVAKSVLTRFKKRLEDGGVPAMLRMMGEIAATAVREKNPLAKRETNREHLRDRAFHLAALSYRENTLARTAAARTRKRMSEGKDADRALLEVQEHLIAAARAYADHLILDWFERRVKSVEHEETRRWLRTLGDLHALSMIDQHMAWFLEDGYLEPVKARAIRKEVEALQRELLPAARSLVDAFAIPDQCLAAPIAFFDPAHPSE